MKCVTSLLLVSTVISIASAVRVPSSWKEEQDYELYKTKLRKTRQKPPQKPVLERRVGGFTQADHEYKTKKSYRPKDGSRENTPNIQFKYDEHGPLIIPLNSEIVNQSVSHIGYRNLLDPVQTSVQNNWTPITSNSQILLPLQNVKPEFQYNGAVKNPLNNKEISMYQGWQESKMEPKLLIKNHSYHKTPTESAEADLIRQLERHKIIQQNLAALDKSPGKLRRIYLEDQLNRNALLNSPSSSSETKIDLSEITFTTPEPEFTQILKTKLIKRPTKQTSSKKKKEVENIHKKIAHTNRDNALHKPYNDINKKDILRELESANENEKLDKSQQDFHDNNKKNEQIHKNENNHQAEDVISEDEDTDSDEEDTEIDEENEEIYEEIVHSEHADPKNIPTKPIYPGEGQWAQPGKKYRPYYSQHRFIVPESPPEKKPDGYDVFEDLSRYFDMQRANFEKQGRFTPDDNTITTRIPSFAEQQRYQILTPPQNTWRPNPPEYISSPSNVNSVNPIVVYDPFSEPSNSQGITSKLKTNTQATPIEYIMKSNKIEPKIFKSNESIKKGIEIDVKKDKENYNDQKKLNQKEFKLNKDDTNTENKEEEKVENENDEYENENEENTEDENLEIDPASVSSEQNDDEDDFIPMQLYAQVRHSANVQHLPTDSEESGRLKEVIRDSKVQTVYTEEGYEDLAYDHAGHEKKAESDEGFAEFEKNKEKKESLQKITDASQPGNKEGSNTKSVGPELKEDDDDTISEQTIMHPIASKRNNKNFLSTEKVKTMELKAKDNGELQMEIQSEIKTMMQPNNSNLVQSSLKIFPTIFQDIKTENNISVNVVVETTTTRAIYFNKKDDAQNVTSLIYNTNQTKILSTKPYVENIIENSSKQSEFINRIKSQPESVMYQENNSATEVYTTEGYFHPETDNFNIKDISVKSIADVFSQLELKNTKKTLQQGTNPSDKIDNQLKKSLATLKREKRGSGFLNINEVTDVTDQIDHYLDLKEPDYDRKKYPYYKNKFIAENSPLRYAESLLNIPNKQNNKLTFYENAEKIKCPELDEPNPIPDQVNNKTNMEYDEYEEKETNTQPKKPRIELGNKINCYKTRYFGENPLDSPFFKEEFVGPVKPLFKELIKKNTLSKDSKITESINVNTVHQANEIFNKLNNDVNQKYSSELKNKHFAELLKQTKGNTKNSTIKVNKLTPVSPLHSDITHFIEKTAKEDLTTISTLTPSSSTITVKIKPLVYNKEQPSTPTPLPTLITTPKYNLKLTPQNIYDQISLLDHLEVSETGFLSNDSDIENIPVEANRRESKSLKDTAEISNVESQPLRRRRKPQNNRPNYNLIVNRRSSTTNMTPYSIFDTNPTTVLPKNKVISEVFYKDKIRPDEQLAVFSDILNNIRNSSNIEEQVKIQAISKFAEPFDVTISSVEAVTKRYNRKKKPNARDTEFLAQNSIDRPDYNKSTSGPININMLNLYDKTLPQFNSQAMKISLSKPGQRRKFPNTNPITTRQTTEKLHKTPLRKNSQPTIINFIDKTKEIVGLVPPSDKNYNTIISDNINNKEDIGGPIELSLEHLYEYHSKIPTSTEQPPAPVSESLQEPIVIQLNKYLFLGLKPPSPQKVRPYTDFVMTDERKDMISYIRIKRDAQRPAYSELSRNRGRQEEILEKPNIKDDGIDDYVPHRPRNYYYDEKTGRIIYLNKPKMPLLEENGEDEIIEYEEITEAALPPQATSPKIKTKLLLATAKPPPPGESFIDFLSRVKSHPNYKFIPDPTTTEKDSVLATASSTTLKSNISTVPPEILSILALVKNDSSYKAIGDPDNKMQRVATTTTDASLFEIEEENEEYDKKHIGSQSGIFDISEYLPEVKEYIPNSNIDYSKYKTINRSKTRQEPSARQSDGKIDYTAIVRARKPVYDEDEKTFLKISTTIETPQEIQTRRSTLKEIDKPTITEKMYEDKQSSIEFTTPEQNPSEHISYYRRRPSKIITTTETAIRFKEKPEKNLEILAPPTQTRRGTRPATTLLSTTPAIEFQEPLTRLPTKRRTTTTPRGQLTSLELVTTTEEIVRVYPENQRAKRVYRRQPVHIRNKSTSESFKEKKNVLDTSTFLPRRSEQLSDIPRSFLNPIFTENNFKESNDREDRSIDRSVNIKNENQATKQQKDVDIIKEYDISKKHGGNLKQNIEDTEEEPNDKVEETAAKPQDNQREVYIVLRASRQNDEDNKNKKLIIKNLADQVNLATKDPQVKVIEKINKTRSSYELDDKIIEEDDLGKENTSKILQRPNIKPKEKKEDKTLTIPIKSIRPILNLKNPDITEKPKRLTDVVPKPDHFYTDPGLPKQVNRLRDEKKTLRVTSDEIDEIVTEGDHIYSSGEEFDSTVKKENQMQDRMDIEDEEDVLDQFDLPEKIIPTKKPYFIKDPEKRLYYYATV